MIEFDTFANPETGLITIRFLTNPLRDRSEGFTLTFERQPAANLRDMLDGAIGVLDAHRAGMPLLKESGGPQ